MNRREFVLAAPLALTACAAPSEWASDDEVNRVMYRGTGPKGLTLYTMKRVGFENGAHSALLIDASQRVVFDPAGTFASSVIPERNDVLFGFSRRIEAYYLSYHSRVTFYVVTQSVEVAPEVAEKALELALDNGSVGQARCARSTSRLLRQLPGFENIRNTYFPNALSNDFADRRGVITHEYYENDDGDKRLAAAQIEADLIADQSR